MSFPYDLYIYFYIYLLAFSHVVLSRWLLSSSSYSEDGHFLALSFVQAGISQSVVRY